MVDGPKALDRAHPRHHVMERMLPNSDASAIRFEVAELAELNVAMRVIEVRGRRLLEAVLVDSGREAPPRR